MLLWGIAKQRGGRGMKREGEIVLVRVELSVHIVFGRGKGSKVCAAKSSLR